MSSREEQADYQAYLQQQELEKAERVVEGADRERDGLLAEIARLEALRTP